MNRNIALISAIAVLLASATDVRAQVPRNGPIWGGKDHQPTQSEVTRLENQAGVRAPPGQVQQDQRSVDQLGRELLHEEAVNPP